MRPPKSAIQASLALAGGGAVQHVAAQFTFNGRAYLAINQGSSNNLFTDAVDTADRHHRRHRNDHRGEFHDVRIRSTPDAVGMEGAASATPLSFVRAKWDRTLRPREICRPPCAPA